MEAEGKRDWEENNVGQKEREWAGGGWRVRDGTSGEEVKREIQTETKSWFLYRRNYTSV